MPRTVGSIAPHGGQLVNRRLRGALREAALEQARSFRRVQLTSIALSDLEMIAVGAFSPLTGFMTRDDYDSVIDTMRLSNGLPWTIPVTLPVSDDVAAELKEGDEIALMDGDYVMGVMTIAEKFPADKEREAREVYRTTEEAHPGVARLHRQGDWLLGGEVFMLNGPQNAEFPELRHEPAQTRRMFAARGWRRIVAFQTRNPIHRAHEYIQKTALEIVDGLFLHPLVGETKKDDIPADVRIESYQAILRDYYPADRVLLGVFPAAMRYAGPREAIFHAIARKNYGCTHFIVTTRTASLTNSIPPNWPSRLSFSTIPSIAKNVAWSSAPRPAPMARKTGSISAAARCGRCWSGVERGEMLPAEMTRPEVSRVLMEGLHKEQNSEAGGQGSA